MEMIHASDILAPVMHRMNVFITLAFAFVALCGNVCLLGTAEAKSPEIQGPRMSLNVPEKCPWINKSVGPIDVQQESPCATGHCFSEPEPETVDLAHALRIASASTIVPPSPVELIIDSTANNSPLLIAASPPPLYEQSTVVLRF